MNFKKFISGVSALTIAASAFAGMAVTVNAAAVEATVGTQSYSISEDFSDASYTYNYAPAGTTATGSQSITVTNFNTVYYSAYASRTSFNISGGEFYYSTGATGGDEQGGYAAAALPNALTGIVTVSYKWNPSGYYGNNNYTYSAIQDSDGKNILLLKHNPSININNAATDEANAWVGDAYVTVNATIDFSNKTITSLTLTKAGETEPYITKTDLAFADSDAANVSRFQVGLNRGTKMKKNYQVKLDDINVSGAVAGYLQTFDVNNGNGSPVSDATVTLTGAIAKTDVTTATYNSSTGLYEAYLPEGSTPAYSITKEGFPTVNGTVPAVATTTNDSIEAVMSSGTDVTYTTTPGASVKLYSGEDVADAATADGEGKVTFNVADGTYTVESSLDGYFTKTVDLTVANGTATTTNDITLTALYDVTYVVNAPTGVSVSGSTSVKVGQDAIPVSVPTITDNGTTIGGYVFLGWSETENGTTFVAPTSIAVEGNKTYYAVFSDQIKRSVRYYPTADSNIIGNNNSSYGAEANNTLATTNPTISLYSGANRGFISFPELDLTKAISGTVNFYVTSSPDDKSRTYDLTCQRTSANWYADNLTTGWNSQLGNIRTTVATASFTGKGYTGWISGKFTELNSGSKNLYIQNSVGANVEIASIENSDSALRPYIELFYTDGYSVKFGDAAAVEYSQDEVIAIPDPGEGYEWSDGTTTYKSGDSYTVTGNVTFTKQAIVVAPTAKVTEVSYNQYEAANTAANDQDITAAKIYVTVTGSIDKLGLKYNKGTAEATDWTDPQYAKDITKITTDGDTDIVLGAIVPGLVELSTSSFDAVIE